MASFPHTPGMDSERIPRAGTRVDFDSDNVPHLRALAAEKFDYKVVLPCVTQAELDAINTFYNTNRLLPFDLSWTNGATVSVKFGQGRPRDKFLGNGVGYRVEFMAHGV